MRCVMGSIEYWDDFTFGRLLCVVFVFVYCAGHRRQGLLRAAYGSAFALL